MNKQVNFTTVMDYRQTFTVDIDFEEIKKDLMANADFDEEEVPSHREPAQSHWEPAPSHRELQATPSLRLKVSPLRS